MDFMRKVAFEIQARQKGVRFQVFLDLDKSKQVLDLGGGSGECFVSAYPHKSHVIRMDKNPHTGIEAKKQFPQIMAVVADGCSLLFRDKSISAIFSNSVIEHVALQGDFAKGNTKGRGKVTSFRH